ncbi:integrase core domain-containing protein [Sulfitobacter sp. 20_GPM-1509m]|uniref:integrase core domain-containing protein n=1 Tax=Sulfitobacter sp. 20_GPM-1509m TaxID=1380367 RepID=UPI00048BC130|nr:integrase core domain-containing protein [Sulfitobacter sp. 20_GPM-1509m]
MYLFENLRHVRDLVAAWRDDFNHRRPHSGLAGLTPQKCYPVKERPKPEHRLRSNAFALGLFSPISHAQMKISPAGPVLGG